MKYRSLFLMSLLIPWPGVVNFRGDISTIHRYDRRKAGEENVLECGRATGTGMRTVGGPILAAAAVQMLSGREPAGCLIVAGSVIGVAAMLHARLKCNRGIF